MQPKLSTGSVTIWDFLYYLGQVFDFKSSNNMMLCTLIIPVRFSALVKNLISINTEYLKNNQTQTLPELRGMEGGA